MDNVFDQTAAFTRLWTDMMNKMWGAGMSWQPMQPPPDAARAMRGSLFQAMSQSLEEFMRSPMILDWMKQSMDVSTTWRKQWNELMTRMRHEVQGTASEDIDSLMLTMRHLESRVLERLDELAERLDDLGARMDGLEEEGHSNGDATRSRSRRRYGRGLRGTGKTSDSGSEHD